MAKKRSTTFGERYWFAIGYHHGITEVKNPPLQEEVDFLLSTLSIQVNDLYEHGWKTGNKDRERGVE
jgi:hypothetical protein